MSILPHPGDQETKLLTLLAHTAMGRRLLPTVWIAADGRCSCMEREKPGDDRVCSRSKPGKHPRISQWQVRASCEPEQIIEWHQWLPLANWGWLQTDTFALDVDPKRGGLTSLTQWEEEAGGPAHTLIQATPSGGWHFIYRQPATGVDGPGGLVRVSGDVLPGIEIRGCGSYIMVDPSTGAEGAWRLTNPDVGPAEADELTLRLIEKHGIDTSLGEPGGDGVEALGVGGLGRGRRKKSSGKSSDLPATDWFLRNGFGDHTGSRNVDAYRLAWRLLALVEVKDSMLTMQHAVDTMKRVWERTDQGSDPFTLEEMWGAFRSAITRRERQKMEDEATQREFVASLVSQL